MKILVCDDSDTKADRWVESLRDEAPVGSDISKLVDPNLMIEALALRRNHCLDHGAASIAFDDAANCLDEADILFVDYDLVNIIKNGPRVVGEDVAREASMYSKCKYVVLVNRYRNFHFDLRMTGHIESTADMNIDADLLDRPGLWVKTPGDRFRPTTWPILTDVIEARRAWPRKVATPATHLLADFGLRFSDLEGVDADACAMLDPQLNKLEQFAGVTFLKYANTLLQHDGTDNDGLSEARQLSENSELFGKFVRAHFIKWLDTQIIRRGDTLCNSLQLAVDDPFLLNDASQSLLFTDDDSQVDLGREHLVFKGWVEAHRLTELDGHLANPIYAKKRIMSDENYQLSQKAFDFQKLRDFVVMEDTSRIRSASTEDAMDFRDSISGFGAARYVEHLEDITYLPEMSFSKSE